MDHDLSRYIGCGCLGVSIHGQSTRCFNRYSEVMEVDMYNYAEIKKFQKSQINGLTKHLSGLRFGASEMGRGNDKMINRAQELGMEVDYNDSNLPGEKFTFKTPRKITKEQTDFGKAWLKSYFFKKDGSPRGGKRTYYISKSTLDIAKRVVRFEFIGVLGVANSFWEIHSFLPIYRAFDSKGNYFDYSPVHWGEPVIMEG